MQKRVTLNLDSEVYKKFQKFCEDRDIIISKRVERLLIEELKDKGGRK